MVVALGLFTLDCHTEYRATFVKRPDFGSIGDHKDDPFLKCHMKDGHVIVLEAWTVDDVAKTVRGYGLEYDVNRERIGPLEAKVVRLDDVVLVETNKPYAFQVGTGSIIALAIGTGVSIGVTVMCATNTKACFGSCPTFFADDGHGLALQAEGFSDAVARALETTDVDAMWTAAPKSRDFDVVMTNDALETHVVDSVRVLAARRPPGGRVLRAGTEYFEATRFTAPKSARADAGDVADKLRASDGDEYKSPASATNLADREHVDVIFPRPAGAKRLGLLVVDRNSLLNTFLFYQALAYAGRRAGDWLAALEAEGKSGFAGLGRLLGDIDVSVRDASGRYVDAGKVGEVGPIAREAELVVFPDEVARGTGDVEVRLTMARGNWKIDQIALVDVGARVEPVALDPRTVTKDGKRDDDARIALLDPKRHLVTYPHDAYTLEFELPEGDQELFLESRGYYYEWMREEWLREEDPLAAARMVLRPDVALRELAPKFKAIEPTMDRIFWQSRVPRW
jgi:hypothetical protein